MLLEGLLVLFLKPDLFLVDLVMPHDVVSRGCRERAFSLRG